MSSIIRNLSTLHYSPIILKDVLALFYGNVQKSQKNILLSYLVLPLYCNDKTFSFFKNARRNKLTGQLISSLTTFTTKKENTTGLAVQIMEFKSLTNSCLQIIIDSENGVIDEDMSFVVNNFKIDANSIRAKAIFNMAEILSEFDVVNTYRILGIRHI